MLLWMRGRASLEMRKAGPCIPSVEQERNEDEDNGSNRGPWPDARTRIDRREGNKREGEMVNQETRSLCMIRLR